MRADAEAAARTEMEFPDYPIEPGCRAKMPSNPSFVACTHIGNGAKAVAQALWEEVSQLARQQCAKLVWRPSKINVPAYMQYQKLEGCLEAQREREELELPTMVFTESELK